MESFDVVVVGAGPAGACAALAARRTGASVLLLDRADFPRDKPCGDGIAAHALDVLAQLGVPDAVAGFAPVPVLRLIAPAGGQVARRLPRPAYTVPRRIFDARLVAAAVTAGTQLRRHPVRRLETRDDLVILDGGLVAARAVVGADGAGSVVRRALGFAGNPDRHQALAIRGYAPAVGPVEQRIVTSAAHWPSYAWSFPIGDGRANIGYGELLVGPPVTRAHLLARLAALLPGVEPAEVTDLRAHHLPFSTRRPLPGRGRVVLAGDALSLINPLTGEGIFYAVLSGALAGLAAASSPARAADRYAALLSRRLGGHLRHSTAAAWLSRRRAIVDAAVRAADRDGQVFDALVELGLGAGRLNPRALTKIAIGLVAPLR